jgi:hypothetical protein
MKPRTIILLSAPRCGTTAVYRIFDKHPDVHALFEPNFWNLAIYALEGRPEKFVKRLNKDYPFLVMPDVFTEETVFRLWDTILRKYGPVVFEKSPFYLGDRKATALLKRYRVQGNDVRLFALIRDPRDAITSQHELWGAALKRSSLSKREALWLDRFDHLDEIQEDFGYIPIFRYEDLVKAPDCYVPMIFHFCDLTNYPHVYNHITPTSIGRYRFSINAKVRRWKMGYALKRHLLRYGYRNTKENLFITLLGFLKMLSGNIKREIHSAQKRRGRIRRQKHRGLLA